MSVNLDAINQSINSMNQTLSKIYTLMTNIPAFNKQSSSAPSATGSIAFTSSEASGFFLQTTSSGATVKIPYYPS